MTVEEITLNGTPSRDIEKPMLKKGYPVTDEAPALKEDTKLERIAESDMAYHKRVLGQNAAIPNIREQINGLQQTLMGIDGASRSWLAYVQETYDLGEGDSVNDAGVIVRVAVDSS